LTGTVVLSYTTQLAPRECVQHERRIFNVDDEET